MINMLSGLIGGAGRALAAPTSPTAGGEAVAGGQAATGFAATLTSFLGALAGLAGGAPQGEGHAADGATEAGEDPLLGGAEAAMAGALAAEAMLIIPGQQAAPSAGAGTAPGAGAAPSAGAAPGPGAAPGSGVAVTLPAAQQLQAEAPGSEAGKATEPGDGVRGAGSARTNPALIERSMSRLDPEFRTRLERVMERMAEEHGHRVELVETFRSPERQAFLFEQGRSRPGPVVTWTRNSNHMQGRAADLIIDGSYGNPVAFARLQRIALAEGLHTLGAKDPGHVELPSSVKGGAPAADLLPIPGAPVEGAPRPGLEVGGFGVARVAEVAEVAQVAPVAQVARVAQVAQVAPVATVAPSATLRQAAEPAGEQAAEAGASAAAEAALGLGGESLASGEPALTRTAVPSEPRVEASRPILGAVALDRIQRVLELQESVAPRPLTHVTLRIDNGAGAADQIRVDLRGTSVGATVDLAGRANTEALSTQVGELQRALEKHGLEMEGVRVRSSAGAQDAAEAARIAVAARSDVEGLQTTGTRGGSDSSQQRDRQGAAHRDTPQSRSEEDPRNRSRREQKGEKNP